MVDLETVCCMCGDVGFSEKLFRCNKCLHRFQHSYCSNYYSECAEPIGVCDWCQKEGKRGNGSRHGGGSSSRKSYRSEYSSADRVKQEDRQEVNHTDKGKTGGGLPSPRPTTRRYKLLKDVMC